MPRFKCGFVGLGGVPNLKVTVTAKTASLATQKALLLAGDNRAMVSMKEIEQ